MGHEFDTQPSPPPPPPPAAGPPASPPSFVPPPPPPPTGWAGEGRPVALAPGVDGIVYSPWSRRVWAYLVRTLSFYVVLIVSGLVARMLGDVGALVTVAGLVFGVASLVRMLIQRAHLGYDVGDAASGQTLIRQVTGVPMGSGWSTFGRSVAHILDALPLYLGFLWPLWDKKRQTFADKVTGTIVVRGGAHRYSANELWLNSLAFWAPVLKS